MSDEEQASSATPHPQELRVSKDRKTLSLSFDDASSYDLRAELLRVLSPSAEVQGHNPAQRKLIAGKRNVEIMTIEPVGNYAVRITFDDMHSSGIYTWKYLYELGKGNEANWTQYVEELAAFGLDRDTPKEVVAGELSPSKFVIGDAMENGEA